MRRHSDASAGTVIDDDLSTDEFIGHTLAVGRVDDDRSAAFVVGGGVFSFHPRACAASIIRRVSCSDRARMAGTPISATISYPALAE